MKKEINKAKISDVYRIEELDKASFDKPWSSVLIEEDMNHEFSNFDLLEVDDKLVGYINYWLIGDDIELNRICILPEFRKMGLASSLLDYLVDLAYEKSSDRILLEVSADNENAIRLYDKFDFKDIYVREKYYDDGSDAIIKERVTNDM